jgi:hypothetical protein
MNRLKQLQWPLMVGMASLAFVHPFMNISGLMDLLGRPSGPLFMQMLISVAWLAIVVYFNVREPVLTLTCTGVIYGVFAFILGAILSPLLTGELYGPMASLFILPFAATGILVTNALWGLAIGLIAQAIQQSIRPRKGYHSDEKEL